MSYVDSQYLSPAPRILLVDDTELNREIIGAILESAGYTVDLASDGEQACAATWSKAYDLVLMDIEMPGMNGFEAAARIRAREGVMSGVKIAALSATRQPDAAQCSFWSGIDAFIAKPIEPKLLLRLVGELTVDGTAMDNDWKPVWRLATFARFAREYEEEGADALREFDDLLEATTIAIDTKDAASPQVARLVYDLRHLAGALGFEELSGLCARIEAERSSSERGEGHARCRDPNLIGAIDRARYALDVYRREHEVAPQRGLWERTRVNVQSLFRGKAGDRTTAG